ncbi:MULTISPECIES: DUF3105 domain-containing protein [Streptomyces]|uniref:DUF3105 domain-containing protein n=1 Tax=Streptomyces antibioticus TaxID=1890 RepID=A0AAE6Y686_STRAT|nr:MULTISPECIES: DUF3105 domain-containing protein [Streptomyces]GLV95155.1 membrane protein [Streptomyces lavendulae subsp. lavendulae]KOU18313.1 membrane protein [Streptomyces sp. WM6349]KOV50563.1 membrane protein [Streptomyces sp. H036]MCX5167368.1 DUF3105 domain-containing protein [Streptomyces antibioticus]OOQ54009.1 hypothetical protein AFM16_05255 [Streptomyces antibioticus]
MSSRSPRDEPGSRHARIEEMRRADRARERRKKITIAVVSAAIVAAAGVGIGYLVSGPSSSEQKQVQGITGEKTWQGLGREHVTRDVSYPMAPPVGGDHHPVWQNCEGNVYGKPVPDENAVHSLEHGAVWVTYTDKARATDVKTLAERVSQTPYTLMSPYSGQTAPITLTAWGRQLNVNDASDSRVAQFFEHYVQGPQTPEPGAPCGGGKSS